MKFCSKCGTALDDAAQACTNCGAPQNTVTNSGDTVMGVLAYLGILVLVPIFAAKDSKFAKFHANQGLVLFVFGLVYGVAYSILSFILAFVPFIGGLIIGLFGLVSLVFLAFAILGIINVVRGDEKELPIVGHFRFLK